MLRLGPAMRTCRGAKLLLWLMISGWGWAAQACPLCGTPQGNAVWHGLVAADLGLHCLSLAAPFALLCAVGFFLQKG